MLKKHFSSFIIVVSLLGASASAEAATQDPYPPPPFGPGSAVRLEVTPKEAEVYADGYFAGSSMSSTESSSGFIFPPASMKSPCIATAFERSTRPST